MKTLEPDITTDPTWLEEQADRLLGFEILHRTLSATYQPMPPELLADKIGADKGYSFKVIKGIYRSING